MPRPFDRKPEIALELPQSFGRVSFGIAEDGQVMDRDHAPLPGRRQEIIGAVEKVRSHDRGVAQILRPFAMLAQPALHLVPAFAERHIQKQSGRISDPFAIAIESDAIHPVQKRKALRQFPAIAPDTRQPGFERFDRKNDPKAHVILSQAVYTSARLSTDWAKPQGKSAAAPLFRRHAFGQDDR